MQDNVENSPGNVLIVDGNRECAERYARHLESRGYKTAIATPKEMLDALARFDATVALCDIEGPDAKGANLPGQLLKARPDLLCIAMATRPDHRQDNVPMREGSCDFIDKSKGVDALAPAIEACFKRREIWRLADTGYSVVKNAQVATQEANRAKVEFLAKISHELRTPLNAIIGFSELMIRDVLGPLGNEQYRTYLGDIHASGRHLLDIINDILDFAKAEAGQLLLFESDVDVRQVAVGIERLLGPRARDAGIELNIRLPADLPLLWCDERKLKQMLLNLVTNAVKFTPTGGTIDIEGGVVTEGFVVAVRDTGVGIAEADLARVLQPFVQADTTLSRRQEGTGLGLALVKAMVEIHGGDLKLESELGKGTLVRLLFPRERVSNARDEGSQRQSA